MGGKCVHLLGSFLFEEIGGGAEGPCSIDHVVNDDASLPFDIADKSHIIHLVGHFSLLRDHGKTDIGMSVEGEVTMELFGSAHTTGIRGNNTDVFLIRHRCEEVAESCEGSTIVIKLDL